MEEGAAGAAQMGAVEIAGRMRQVAAELPAIRTPEAAATLAPRLKELSDQTWDLGRRCGGHLGPPLTPENLTKARELAKQVKDGTLTMDQAIKQVR